MKLPLITISYGNFAISKKLLSYDREGEHLIPIFTDLNHAQIFAEGMLETMQKMGDNRELICQICSNRQHAIDLFTTIGTLSTQPPGVIINPARPNYAVGATAAEAIELIEEKMSIGEMLEALHQDSKAE